MNKYNYWEARRAAS